jgi:hypothetical protein
MNSIIIGLKAKIPKLKDERNNKAVKTGASVVLSIID